MKKILGLVLGLAILLAGCVQYDEQLILNKEGSGQITIKMGVMDMEAMLGADDLDDLVISEEEAEELDEFPGITVVNASTYAADGFQWSEMTLEFESLEALAEALEGADIFATANISFANEGGALMFRRTIPILNPEDDLEVDFNETMPMAMVEMFFADVSWVYEVTFPGRVIATNAKDEDIDPATNTVRWPIAVTDLFGEEFEMWAQIAL